MLTDRQGQKPAHTAQPQIEVCDGSISDFGVRVTNKRRKSFLLFSLARWLSRHPKGEQGRLP